MIQQEDDTKVIINMLVLLLDSKMYLSKEEKRIWLEFCLASRRKLTFFSRVYHGVIEGIESVSDEETGIAYQYDGLNYCMEQKDERIELKKEQLMDLLSATISLLERIYPLGTVVELKMNYTNPKSGNKEHYPVVITHRFLSPKGEKNYFEYAGVTYPTGMMESDKLIFFTHESIFRVLQKGYIDQREKEFVLMMKDRLIVKEQKVSVAFSEDASKYKQFVHNGGENIE